MIKRDVAYFIVMFILLSSTVYAEGISGKPYKFIDVPSCYGDIQVKVNEFTNVNRYAIINCTYVSGIEWSCPCMNSLYILTPPDTETHFSIFVQYFISKPRIIPSPSVPPSNDEQYNEEIKRIKTINGIFIVPSIEDKTLNKEEEKGILIILILVGVIFVFILILAIMIFLLGDNIKRWLGMDEDEKLTFGKLLKNVFSRPSIDRKDIGKRDDKPKETLLVKEQKVNEKIEDEVRKILKEIS